MNLDIVYLVVGVVFWIVSTGCIWFRTLTVNPIWHGDFWMSAKTNEFNFCPGCGDKLNDDGTTTKMVPVVHCCGCGKVTTQQGADHCTDCAISVGMIEPDYGEEATL